MQIVIEIPEEIYCRIMARTDYAYDVMRTIKAVERGKPLPKGHGRLVDADEVMNVMERNLDMQDLYLPIHFKQFALDEAQTIIEADKEGADEEVEG